MSQKKGSAADCFEAMDEDSVSELLTVSPAEKSCLKKKTTKKRNKKSKGASNRLCGQKQKAALDNKRSNKKTKSIARVDTDEEYHPPSQQSSFESALKEAEDDYDAEEDYDEESLDGVAGLGSTTTTTADAPNTNTIGVETREELVQQATLLCHQAIVQLIQDKGDKADAGTGISIGNIPLTTGMAETVWAEVVGTNTTETTITYTTGSPSLARN